MAIRKITSIQKDVKLTDKDYKTILKYYKIPFDNIKRQTIKQKAENILAEKLCRCIKKVRKSFNNKNTNNTKKSNRTNIRNRRGYIKNGTRKINESRAIGLCKKAVLHKKGLTDTGFKCRNVISITLKKYKNTKKRS